MTEKVTVEMLRAIGGYALGAKRELSSTDAKRLSDRGVARIVRAKAEPAPKNKAEPALKNKSA